MLAGGLSHHRRRQRDLSSVHLSCPPVQFSRRSKSRWVARCTHAWPRPLSASAAAICMCMLMHRRRAVGTAQHMKRARMHICTHAHMRICTYAHVHMCTWRERYKTARPHSPSAMSTPPIPPPEACLSTYARGCMLRHAHAKPSRHTPRTALRPVTELTCLLTRLLADPHLFAYSLAQLLACSVACLLSCLLTQSLAHSLACLLTCSSHSEGPCPHMAVHSYALGLPLICIRPASDVH